MFNLLLLVDFQEPFLSGFLKGFLWRKSADTHTHKCHQYFPRWWSSCEGSISVYFWFNKDDKASTQDFPRLNQDSRPTFWRKIYWQQCLENKWTQKRRFSTPGASLVKIECTFFISTSSRPKLIYNEARHTSSTSLKSQQTLMNWSSCWYYHTQYQTSPLLYNTNKTEIDLTENWKGDSK